MVVLQLQSQEHLLSVTKEPSSKLGLIMLGLKIFHMIFLNGISLKLSISGFILINVWYIPMMHLREMEELSIFTLEEYQKMNKIISLLTLLIYLVEMVPEPLQFQNTLPHQEIKFTSLSLRKPCLLSFQNHKLL